MVALQNNSTPGWRALIFWGGVLLVILQAERLFLLPEVIAVEPPTASLLAKTLFIGLGNDVLVAVGGMALVLVLAGILTIVPFISQRARPLPAFYAAYRRSLIPVCLLIAILLACFVTADVGYYAYNHTHLDFVFFEYVQECFRGVSEGTSSQAAEQTEAELDDASKWVWRIGGPWGLGAMLIIGWRALYKRLERFGRSPWNLVTLTTSLLVVSATMSGAAAGFGRVTLPFVEVLSIQNSTYYSLSQNPILFAVHPLRDAFLSHWTWSPSPLPLPMTVEEAIQETHLALGHGELFPYSNYPLVRAYRDPEPPYFSRPINVLLVFVEGLDRRFLDRIQTGGHLVASDESSVETSSSIRLTPFLDRLKRDSLYFSHFFSNGVQTTRGLFSTLCSAFPRQGTAAIKTRYKQDYLCLPSVLQQAGYHTEMVLSLDADLPGLHTFLSKNGIDRYYVEQDFSSADERVGVGPTDGALLDFVETRLVELQSSGHPFFLSTLTTGTHHPFVVPNEHAEVKALQRESDRYPAALRYFDLVFEQFFSRLQSKGLLQNTMVLILGDHGRHETIGQTDVERQVGHFLSPLYLWVDDSLRTESNYRPRVVEQVVSQVDIAPTVLAITGLTPHAAPFVGRSASCLLKADCLGANHAYLSSVYDDLIGLADQSGIWLYSFRTGLLTSVDLNIAVPGTHPVVENPAAMEHLRIMTALYLASNTLLEQNRIWSSKTLGQR